MPNFTKPQHIAATVGGIIVNGPKTQLAGFINPPTIDPVKVDNPPKIGPIIIPERGATITPMDMNPDTPMAIVKGNIPDTVCIAANRPMSATFNDVNLYIMLISVMRIT